MSFALGFGYARLGKPQARAVRSLAKRSGISKGQRVEAHPSEDVQWRVEKVVGGGFEYIASGKVCGKDRVHRVSVIVPPI